MARIDILELESQTLKRTYKEDGEPFQQLLLNCTLAFVAIDEEAGKVLVDICGKRKVVSFTALASQNDLLKLIRPYSFFGKSTDIEYLINFWRLNYQERFNKGEALVLKVLEGYQGRYKDESVDFWICGDKIVSHDGYILFNYKKVFSFENRKKIFHVDNTFFSPELQIQTGPKSIELLNSMPIDELCQVTMEKYLKVYKNQHLLYTILGWFIACMYTEEVFDGIGGERFPMFAVSGLTQTGKTSLLSLLMYFWGGKNIPSDYTMTSSFIELKELSQVHNYPIWRDEYRANVGKSREKESLLRSLYNKSTVSKGTANQTSKIYSLSGSMLLSGEDMVLDPAIRRRFIYFMLNTRDKLSATEWEDVARWAEDDLYLMWWIALRKGWNAGAFKRYYAKARTDLKTSNDKSEEAVCIAALAAVYGEKIADDALWLHATQEVKEEENLDRKSITEQLFDFIMNEMTYMFQGRLYGNNPWTRPDILNYFSGDFITQMKCKLQPLITLAYQKGFKEETTLSAKSVFNAVTDELKATRGRFSINNVTIRGILIETEKVPRKHVYHYLLENLRATHKNTRLNLTVSEREEFDAQNDDMRDLTITS